MKLSIVVPTHGTTTKIKSNLLSVACAGSDDVEVIIHDNSANAEKREFLLGIQEKNCRVIFTDECPSHENFVRAASHAKGEFIFIVADDDLLNNSAVPAICERIDAIRGDASTIGVTGVYVSEDYLKCKFVHFNTLDKPTALDRVRANLEGGFPSILLYTPFRADALKKVWDYYFSMPLHLSYHDWLLHGLYLMQGKLSYVERYFYHYNNANWSSPEEGQKHDERYARIAGLDPSVIELQWLTLAFEGARTFADKYNGPGLPQDERNELAVYWFNHWFQSFVNRPVRRVQGARFEEQTLKLSSKWRAATTVNIPELLGDITEYYALSSPDIAQKYFDFWK